jgi:hypothetical protein
VKSLEALRGLRVELDELNEFRREDLAEYLAGDADSDPDTSADDEASPNADADADTMEDGAESKDAIEVAEEENHNEVAAGNMVVLAFRQLVAASMPVLTLVLVTESSTKPFRFNISSLRHRRHVQRRWCYPSIQQSPSRFWLRPGSWICSGNALECDGLTTKQLSRVVLAEKNGFFISIHF